MIDLVNVVLDKTRLGDTDAGRRGEALSALGLTLNTPPAQSRFAYIRHTFP